jgi:sugar/nucleoside kinase (ribokinase family)
MARLGVAPRLIASIGDDDLGGLLTETLRRGGVDTSRLAVVSAPTGICIAFESDERDRSFLIAPGSVAALTPVAVPVDALTVDAVLLGGYFLLPGFRGPPAAEVFRLARLAGARTFLDTGWDPGGWSETRSEVLGLLPLVDVFLPNVDEACELSGLSDPVAATGKLQRTGGGWVVTKRGADGCTGAGPGGETFSVAALSVRVLDTTGAGDAFNAGLIVALGEGASVPDAAKFATRVASAVVARPSDDRYPGRDELDQD